MSQNTPIESFANQSKLDRTGEALGKVWVANTSASNMISQEGPFHFTGVNTTIPSAISDLIECCTDRLFISTSSFSDSNIIQAVEGALRRSVRIYMLVDTKGFDAILSNSSCGAIIGNVLLRERQQRGLDLVISDWHLPTAQGFVLTTPLDGTLSTESNGWALELDKNQIDELSKHVQHEFWSNKAPGREVLSSDEAQSPVEIAQAPAALSSIYNGDYVLRSNFASDGDHSQAEATLLKEKAWQGQFIGASNDSKIILHGKTIELGSGALQTLHSSPHSTEPSSGHFAHSGISIQLAIGNEGYIGGWDRSADGDWHSILRLTTEQAKAANSLLKKYSESPEWFGHSSIKLGDAGNQIIRNGLEIEISDKQTENLGIVHLEKMPDSAEALKTHQPPMNPPESSLARQCTFEWVSAPPVTPSSASEDDLHAEWKGVRSELQKRLNALDELNQPSKIPGFGRKAKELQKSIDTGLASSATVSDPKSLSTLIDTVEGLTESVGGNLDDIKAAEDETARAVLEKEQRESHKVAVTDAKKAIKDITGRLDKSKGELKKLETDGKKAEGVEKKRIESDLGQLRPKIKQMESDLTRAKEVSNSKFVFKAPASLPSTKKGESKGHKFLGDTRESKLNLKVPSEALPAVGTLYLDGESRYLAISNWEEVNQGRKDAKRLKATLCATREVLG